MATYNNVLGVLREYRNDLEQSTQTEAAEFGGVTSAFRTFAARGITSAFSTPLTNVHATGIGLRLRNGKIVKNDFVIKVYVFEKVPLGDAVPDLTKSYKGVGVDVEMLPVQLALAKTKKKVTGRKTRRGASSTEATTIDDHRSRHRPIVGGVSIAPINERFVGTLGCFLQRTDAGGTRQVYALSNNHVLADTNRLPIRTLIVQPGPEVAPATSDDVFGALSDLIPIQFPSNRSTPVMNVFDAAIALVTDESLIKKSAILGIDNFKPKVGVAVPGMRVIKSGRTTGVTTGIVTASRVNGTQVNYGTRISPRIATFNDTIQIVSDVDGKPFSSPGDSGSVIIDVDTGQPVALLFAGDGVTTTACDLGGVCKQFQALPF